MRATFVNRLRLPRWIMGAMVVLAAVAAQAQDLVGRVVAVADGDTITVLDSRRVQHKVRLVGIDAPERKQAFGQRARQALSDLVFSRQVVVEFDKTDRYDRILGKILVDGQDVNLKMVEAGMAWHFKRYQNDQSLKDRVLYGRAEDQARSAGRGLWADRDPIPPWDWRSASR